MDLHVILTLGEYSFKRIVTGWFIRLLGVGAVLVLVLLFMGGPTPQEDLLNHKTTALDLIGLTAIMLVMVMGATEIPRDVETQTILLLLSKPISKDDVVLGKYLGLVYVAGFTILVLSAVLLAGCLVLGWFEPAITEGYTPDANLLQKIVFRVFHAIVVGAAVTLLSTRLSEIPIIAFSTFYTLLGFFIFYLRAIIGLHFVPTTARIPMYLIYYAVPNLKYLQIPPEVTNQGTVSWAHFFLALLYALLYSAILLVLAVRSFRRREVAG